MSDIVKIGVSVTKEFESARVCLSYGENSKEWTANISPEKPFLVEMPNENELKETAFSIKIFDSKGFEIISYQPKMQTDIHIPEAASEPLLAEEIESVEELFLTGLHLEQYRHATRKPEKYWLEALKRDPLDSRCNNVLGIWHLRRGEYSMAVKRFQKAIERITKLNPNPSDGEPFYNLGLALRYQLNSQAVETNSLFDRAYSAFYKSAWNEATASAAYFALAQIDCRRRDWQKALFHTEKSLDLNRQNLSARCLKAMALQKIGREDEAEKLLEENLQIDALDWWSSYLLKGEIGCDRQTVLDVVHNFADAGFYVEAIDLLIANLVDKNNDLATQNLGTLPLIFYTLAWLYLKMGEREKAVEFFRKAANENSDYCFPNRLEEIAILEAAMRENPSDSFAPYYLGNLFYDRRRYSEAIELWERAAESNNNFSIVWRNLGIAYFNVEKDSEKALQAYEKAFSADKNARLLFERDQLWKRVGKPSEIRLRELEKFPDLVAARDDLTVEICAIYNQLNQPETALQLLENRHFQPWEGGEGQVLQQFVAANILLGRRFLSENKLADARRQFAKCLNPPKNLAETHHLLANKSDIFYWLGVAEEKSEKLEKAFEYWTISADAKGDFQEMSVTQYSEMTFFSALSLIKLGKSAEAENLLKELLIYAENLEKTEAKIDYFATSLPTMLLFDDDIQKRQQTKALFLQAQGYYSLGRREKSLESIGKVLANDANHQLALTISDIEI